MPNRPADPDHAALVMVRSAIESRLQETGDSQWKQAKKFGLSRQAIRYILEGRDCRWTSVAEVLAALELELYVGPVRHARKRALSPEALALAAVFERVASGTEDDAPALGQIVSEAHRMLGIHRTKSKTARKKSEHSANSQPPA